LYVQANDHRGGAVDHAEAVLGVGAQHHHIPDRKHPIADREPIWAELARLDAEPLADTVELVDLAATVGVDHRPLTLLVGLPPVADQGAVAVVAGLERLDAVMLGIGRDRLLQVAGPHVLDRPLLPRFDLPAIHHKLGRTKAQAQGAKAAASLDRGELAVVTDQHHLGPRPLRMTEQRRELSGGDHGRLVHHQHRPAVQLRPTTLELEQQPVDGAGVGEAFVGQPDGGDPGGAQPRTW
jgi:hypothetical protein